MNRTSQGSRFKLKKYVFLVTALNLFTACSGVVIHDSQRRGLFQLGDKTHSFKERGTPVVLLSRDQPLKVPGKSIISDRGFIWPLKSGRLTSFFGPRSGEFHEGLDMQTRRGDPVYAAASGKVIFSGRAKKGYGNLIIVQHGANLISVYAHNEKNIARYGTKIRQGQILARVGSTGRATGPHLHFEIRIGEKPMDPLYYLTPPTTPSRNMASYGGHRR